MVSLNISIETGDSRNMLDETIDAILTLYEKRDPYTAVHQRRVARLAGAIAGEMGLHEEQIDGIRTAGAIHDIGKATISMDILAKPGKLNDYEFNIIKGHTAVTFDVISALKFPWPIAQAIYQHHERLDGSGYPQGLRGEDIILEAKIIGVADVVEAMCSDRPYRPALGIDMALEEISGQKGVLYNPDVVDACLRLFVRNGFNLEYMGNR